MDPVTPAAPAAAAPAAATPAGAPLASPMQSASQPQPGPRHKLIAKTVFYNARITGEKVRDGIVQPGDDFETDTNHAQDLVRGGLAEAVDLDAVNAAERAPEFGDPRALSSTPRPRTTKL